MLDHEKLDVYQVSLEFATWVYELCKTLKDNDRLGREQLLKTSQSISLNIAAGNGTLPSLERRGYLQQACTSARECGAIIDILYKCKVLSEEDIQYGKKLLVRIVSMLTKMISYYNEIREDGIEYSMS